MEGLINLWPEELPKDETLETFLKLYQKYKFEACGDHHYEEGYRKIAIYVDPNTKKVTHASRQRTSGEWTRELGPQQDIAHSDPYSIESIAYGNVALLMRKKLI